MTSGARFRHFFVIGAQRCGTTFLRTLLDDHPEIAMAVPVRPEPKHFIESDSGSTTPDGYRSRWFPGITAAVLGEKSTSYLDHPAAAERIRAVFPGARIVVCLRDPVERAISHYRFSVEHGLEALAPEDALTLEAERRPWDRVRTSVSPHEYVSRGEYLRQLRPWMEVFGAVQVVVLERLRSDIAEIHGLYEALGVDATHTPAIGPPENTGRGPSVVLSPEARRRLVDHYRRPNRELSDVFGDRFEAWES